MHFWGCNQHHFKRHTSPIQAPLVAPLEVHFWGCNQRHFRRHTSLVQAPLTAPLEVHFWGCNRRHFKRHTSPVQAPLAEPLEVPFFGLQPAPFQASYQSLAGIAWKAIGSVIFWAVTNAVSSVFLHRQEVPFGSAIQALFATIGSHQWGLTCWWCW